MNLPDALKKAEQIVGEEQVHPTVGYRYVSDTWPSNQRFEESELRKQGYIPVPARNPICGVKSRHEN